MPIHLDPSIFRAYDIRGIVGDNLTEEIVCWIGQAFAAQALERGQTRVVVGRDGRHSSPAFQEALNRGLAGSGLHVFDIGLAPTPLLYFAALALDTGAGVMVTGSHNPAEYNGLKMVLGGEALPTDRIARIKGQIEDRAFVAGQGRVERVEILDRYMERLLADISIAHPLKLVVDCGNGVTGRAAPPLLRALGCDLVELHCEVDGDFPHHHPDPADPANLQDLIAAVEAHRADLGIAFDGDGDRIGLVTRGGGMQWPDKLLMLFAQDIASRNPGAGIVYDVKCTHHLGILIERLGGRPIVCRTGHSHIKAKLKETGALLGGEFSGHICFGERWYGFDDAIYAAARLLEILDAERRPADELFAGFPATHCTPELKIETSETEKFQIIEALTRQADFAGGALTGIDGLRVDYSDGWGLIRASNTSPALTLRFEADSPAALDRIRRDFQIQLNGVDARLEIPQPDHVHP